MNSLPVPLGPVLAQVPANRIGFTSGVSLAQRKITHELITLPVFVPFVMACTDQPFQLDFVWAGLCRVGAGCFIFRR